MSILNLLEQINRNEIVLPAIQRDFVWTESQIIKLMDSIMREYPIGIILLWETYNNIQYRNFIKDYWNSSRHMYHNNTTNKRLNVIIDGQQRLQSLYIGIYGSYEGKYLYFDIMSGRDVEDFREVEFKFSFFTEHDAEIYNEKSKNNHLRHPYEVKYFIRVKDIIDMSPKEQKIIERTIEEQYKLSDDDNLRVSLNLSILQKALSHNDNILKDTIIDKDKSAEHPDRKSESEILEAFVRINQAGKQLSNSDLIFGILKLNWGESAQTLPDFVDSINEGNSFDFDTDFVIRCLFAVSNLGTKFDPDILRNRSNVNIVKDNFQQCCDAIKSTVDFVQNDCWIASSKLIRSYNNLIPFVYYLFNIPDYQVPNSEIVKVRKALYLFGFTSPFSRYADSRLNKFIREDLKLLSERGSKTFPLNKCYEKIFQWENVTEFDSNLFQRNSTLALHLIQRRSGVNVHYDKNAPQIDHIFPKSLLKNESYEDNEINYFANYWILSKNKNQNKYNKHPQQFFADVDDSILKKAYINRELLDLKKYKKFIKTRETNILQHIKDELDFKDKIDFPYSVDNLDLDLEL